MTHHFTRIKNESLAFELSLMGSIGLCILLFTSLHGETKKGASIAKTISNELIEVVSLPPNTVLDTKLPPPPEVPKLEISELENDIEIEELTVEETRADNTLKPDIHIKPIEREPVEPHEIWRISEKPVLIKRADVVYPKIAKQAHIEALVVVSFVINKNGTPIDLKIIKGHPMLNEAALEAIAKYRFIPGKQNGDAVPVKYTQSIRFRIY